MDNNTSWLAGMFSNPVADAVLIVGALAIIITVSILAKKGLLSLNIKGVSIGNDEKERMICRQQVEYCKAAVDTFIEEVGYSTENRYRARYISELALDELVSCIMYNHITKDTFYIDGKVDRIWSQIIKYSVSPEYKTEEFKSKVSSAVRKCIEHLVDIRAYYKNEKK